jgi:2-polyprenyl-3-methyl-5-hydroxy-6-metoxy-1,4-benzoquinol methylase
MDYENKPEAYYKDSRKEMLVFLPKDAKKILDVGCGNGVFSNLVKEKNKAEVWGIELMPNEAEIAKNFLHKVFTGPCEEQINNVPNNYFDAIYFNDVLEHLVDPYKVLEQIKSKLAPNGVIISSIPNIRYHNVFIKLLFKKEFEYQSYGVLDKTHLRFFTKKSIKNMYTNLGFEVLKHVGINGSKSLKPILYNIPVLFTMTDIKYPQYATVAKLKN